MNEFHAKFRIAEYQYALSLSRYRNIMIDNASYDVAILAYNRLQDDYIEMILLACETLKEMRSAPTSSKIDAIHEVKERIWTLIKK